MDIIDISMVALELGLSSTITDEERAIIGRAIHRSEGAIKRYLKYDPIQRSRTEYYPQRECDFQSTESYWETTTTHAYIRKVSEASTSELQVQHIPIRNITSLRVDYDGRGGEQATSFPASSEQTRGTDYWLNSDGQDSGGVNICRDGIIRSFGAWPTSPGSVRITYTGGYTRAELHGNDTIVDATPIMDVALDEACRLVRKIMVWRKNPRTGFLAGPIQSERMGDYSYSVGTGNSDLINRMFGGLYDLLPESKDKLSTFVNYGWVLAS